MKASFIGLGFFGVFWTALVGGFDGFLIYGFARQTLATSFPSVLGRITHSEVTRHRGGKGRTNYGVRIEYAYAVGDHEFQGSRFRYGQLSSSDSKWAYAAVQAHPTGSQTQVFYNPDNPADSLLSPGLESSDFFAALFLTPFNVVMLGLWAAGGSALWYRLRRPPAGGVWLRTKLRQTRVRLVETGPVSIALAAMAVAAFIATFIVAFGFGGFHPPRQAMLGAWVLVLLTAFIAGLVQWRRISSGRYDLTLDELAGTIELPAGKGTAPRKRLPFSAARSVSVETTVRRTSKGGSSTIYTPILHLAGHQGGKVPLGKFNLESRAQAFAAWLRQRLKLPAVQPPE